MLNFVPTKEEAVTLIAKTIRIGPAMTSLRVVFRDQGVWRFAAEQNTIDAPFPPQNPQGTTRCSPTFTLGRRNSRNLREATNGACLGNQPKRSRVVGSWNYTDAFQRFRSVTGYPSRIRVR
jgi:hypothetical protein